MAEVGAGITTTTSNECVVKPLVQSKGFHFNVLNMIIIPIIWPFLTKEFRSADYAVAVITAWYLIGNAAFRVLTRYRALKILTEMDHEITNQVLQHFGDDGPVGLRDSQVGSQPSDKA